VAPVAFHSWLWLFSVLPFLLFSMWLLVSVLPGSTSIVPWCVMIFGWPGKLGIVVPLFSVPWLYSSPPELMVSQRLLVNVWLCPPEASSKTNDVPAAMVSLKLFQ